MLFLSLRTLENTCSFKHFSKEFDIPYARNSMHWFMPVLFVKVFNCFDGNFSLSLVSCYFCTV